MQRINEARQAFGQMDHQFGTGLVRPVVLRYLKATSPRFSMGATTTGWARS
ncbi:hypothetical protein [Sphaerisporangium aureirubrum]|uniref:Uncharacterized protein n=1 Tax=Sphaerisporangium aureirubrum TaxID=1544736 RepID=A0ABW1NK75_9ACTN